MNPTERCWRTGNYTDDCMCEFCNHNHECSGYEWEGEECSDDDDDEE